MTKNDVLKLSSDSIGKKEEHATHSNLFVPKTSANEFDIKVEGDFSNNLFVIHTDTIPSHNSNSQITDINNLTIKQCEIIKSMKKQLKCPFCPKDFSYEHNLTHHLNSHCFVCFEIFLSNDLLTEHVSVTHVNDASYHCLICRKDFVKAFDLYEHVKVHAGKTPYICVCCDSVFCQPHGVTNHIKQIHTVDRVHMC